MAESNNKHAVAAKLRQYAQKIAAEKAAAGEGAPDRMTIADGQGGISAEKKQPAKDVGEDELKCDQPTDGSVRTAAAVPAGGPDRMTVADGQGGITTTKGTIPSDVGEGELTADLPADGEVRKAAGISNRAARIRAALTQANPALGARIQKAAAAVAPKHVASPAEKRAGEEYANSIAFSQETLAKIASAVLSTDEGVQFIHDALEKQAGEAAAREQIHAALNAAQTFDQGEQIKSAAFDDFQYKVANIHQNLIDAGVTDADADAIIKQASYHQARLASLDHPLMKAAMVQGMDDAALLGAADDAAGEEGVPPVEEAMPMGGEELGEEEIMALLEEMLASGEITEEDIMAAVAATEGGGGEGGGLPPEAGGAPPAPAEEPAMA